MDSNSFGQFWAVGVGPGDPELLTLKAVNLLRRAHVIYHAGPQAQQGRAWDIVHGFVRPDQESRILLTEPMSVVSASDWRTQYRPGVEQIAADCRQGRDVAYVTEGDPTVYSTASYVWQLLAELAPEIPVEVVPGVSSITAAAARLGWPLAQKKEMFAVVPASYHPADLHEVLKAFPTVCLLKVARTMPQVSQALSEAGGDTEWTIYAPSGKTINLLALGEVGGKLEAAYVENLGTSQEWISRNLAEAADRKSYFSLVLVRRTPRDQPEKSAGSTSPQMGKVWVVGLGPGEVRLLTGQALEILRAAEVIIGYDGYLELLAPLSLRAELRGSPIGAERERAEQALEAAAAGRRVVVVSSGDAGVYGMGSLLLETADQQPAVEVELVPGVTAATAAAALLGAPLGHDFACISLSDLLTPWEVIEKRLEAAGQGDFVVALYNPLSRRRTWQLPRARELLLPYRRPETPVGLVQKAYRPGMRLWHTTLGQLTPDGVTMETLLIIGSSTTRMSRGRMVTPRGYEQPP